MDRRNFLRLLALGVIGHELDIDRLLWMPGQKKIFLPTIIYSYGRPITLEMMSEVIKKITIRNMPSLFDRDDVFYRKIVEKVNVTKSRGLDSPLEFREKNGIFRPTDA